MISFFCAGIPRPGGSKRASAIYRKGPNGPVPVTVNGRVLVNVREDCQKTRDWRAVVADCGRQAMEAAGRLGPFSCPLRVDVVFHLLRPKWHFGSGKNAGQVRASAPAHPAVRPDLTKAWRSTEDSLNGICWTDDALIVEQYVRKVYSDRSGAEIKITVLEPVKAVAIVRRDFAIEG